MTTWPEMQLPPINLYNAPRRGKDAIVSDRDEFEAWIDVSRYAMAAPSTEEAMFCTWQAARCESFILRKQAEAVERLRNEIKDSYPLEPFGDLDEYVIAGIKEVYTFVELYSQHLRQQADELEKAGGSL